MNVVETNLPGVLQIEPKVYIDERGFFIETYSSVRYMESCARVEFVQDCHSQSKKSVLRGLHYQLNYPQGKLVRVTRGCAFDVAVDIRVGSPTFGKAVWTLLDDKNHFQFYIPPGFAHGFCALSDTVDFEYKCTDYYHPEDEGTILWNDPNLSIPWPIDVPIVSKKDSQAGLLSRIPENRLPIFKEG